MCAVTTSEHRNNIGCVAVARFCQTRLPIQIVRSVRSQIDNLRVCSAYIGLSNVFNGCLTGAQLFEQCAVRNRSGRYCWRWMIITQTASGIFGLDCYPHNPRSLKSLQFRLDTKRVYGIQVMRLCSIPYAINVHRSSLSNTAHVEIEVLSLSCMAHVFIKTFWSGNDSNWIDKLFNFLSIGSGDQRFLSNTDDSSQPAGWEVFRALPFVAGSGCLNISIRIPKFTARFLAFW